MSDEEKVENLEEGAIETQNEDSQEEDTQDENSQEEAQAPDPKEKRHAEQLAWSKKEVEKFKSLLVDTTFNDIVSQKKDVSSLLELYNRDPVGKKVAEEVALKFDRGNSEWWTFQNFLSWTKQSGKTLSDEEIEALVDKREAEREHKKALERLEKWVKKLPENQQEEVQAYIDKFSKWLLLDNETATTLLESATLFVNKDKLKKDRKEDAIVSMAWSWISGSSQSPKSDDLVVDGYVRKNGKRIPA